MLNVTGGCWTSTTVADGSTAFATRCVIFCEVSRQDRGKQFGLHIDAAGPAGQQWTPARSSYFTVPSRIAFMVTPPIALPIEPNGGMHVLHGPPGGSRGADHPAASCPSGGRQRLSQSLNCRIESSGAFDGAIVRACRLHYVDPHKKHSRWYTAMETFSRSRSRSVHGAQRVPSHRPVAVPRYRRSLSVGPRRTCQRRRWSRTGAKIGQRREHQLTYFHDGPDPILTASNYGGAQASAVVLQPEGQSSV